MKAYRTHKDAQEQIEGTYHKQYALLWDYAEEIKCSNVGSTVEFQCDHAGDGTPVFKRLYIAYDGCKATFNKGCRNLIGLDGYHMKGSYTGQLLNAIGTDANNSLVHIAFVVIESECKDSWTWFLSILREMCISTILITGHLSQTSRKVLQNPLKRYVKVMWRPSIDIALDTYNQISPKSQMLKRKMMIAAKAYIIEEFRTIMEEIKVEDKDASELLIAKSPRHWARSHFRTTPVCDLIVNNLCESFNGTKTIVLARTKPILLMLEWIRMYLLRRFTRHQTTNSK